jgi:hypothetical protein
MENNCILMEVQCLERAKLDPLNRGTWIAQAERWYELGRAYNSWRHQKRPHQQPMRAGPKAMQRSPLSPSGTNRRSFCAPPSASPTCMVAMEEQF